MIHIRVYPGLRQQLATIFPKLSDTDLMIDGSHILSYTSYDTYGKERQTLEGINIYDLRYNQVLYKHGLTSVPSTDKEASREQVNLLVLLARAIGKPSINGDGVVQSLRSLGYDLTDIKIVRNYITDGLHFYLKSDDKREVTLEQLLVYIE